MIDTGIYFPLRIYDHNVGQPEFSENRRECVGFFHREYFWCGENTILPFQVTGGFTSVSLKNLHTDTEVDITSSLSFDTETVDGITYKMYLGGSSPTVPGGLYQLIFDTNQNYSDPFYVGDVSEMVHLKYRGTAGTLMDNIYWHEGLFAECYINSVIDKPEYPIFEDTREDQRADQHKVFQRWDKRHSVRLFGVESMADAMSILPLMDYVEVDGERVYDVEVDIVWEEERQCLAEIVISFSTRKIVKTF